MEEETSARALPHHAVLNCWIWAFVPALLFLSVYGTINLLDPEWKAPFQQVPMIPYRHMITVLFLFIYVLLTAAWCIQSEEDSWFQFAMFVSLPLFHVVWLWSCAKRKWLFASYVLQCSQLILLAMVFFTEDWTTRITLLPINTFLGWIAGYTVFVTNWSAKNKF
jgi:hypothetical protein